MGRCNSGAADSPLQMVTHTTNLLHSSTREWKRQKLLSQILNTVSIISCPVAPYNISYKQHPHRPAATRIPASHIHFIVSWPLPPSFLGLSLSLFLTLRWIHSVSTCAGTNISRRFQTTTGTWDPPAHGTEASKQLRNLSYTQSYVTHEHTATS